MRLTRVLRTGQLLKCSTASSRLAQFSQWFQPIWQDTGAKGKLGLAVSGGVDSMALASLCVRLNREENLGLDIHAFVVDHHLRSGSTTEAHAVAREAQNKLGIATSVLSATGLETNQPLEHVERTARQARYRLLGQACVDKDIGLLFTGHHADDQAATLLLRLVNGYLGEGLSGISTIASLPECDGMYGMLGSGSSDVIRSIDRSSPFLDDHPRALHIEQGGIQLGRPLLAFSKNDLMAECQDQDLNWHEDITNKDQSYTTRNTLNALLENEVLPLALCKPRLLQVARERQQRRKLARQSASQMMSDCTVKLSTRTGRLVVHLADEVLASSRQQPAFEEAIANVIRTMVLVVTPKSEVSLQAVSQIVDDLRTARSIVGKTWNVRSVRVSCTSSDGRVHRLKLARTNPLASEASSILSVKMPAGTDRWTEWQLWDGRYWFRVKQVGHDIDRNPVQLQLRFMRREDTIKMSQKLSLAILQDTPSFEIRRTLPILIECREFEQKCTERIMAVPTLGLSDTGAMSIDDTEHKAAAKHQGSIWVYEMRYKSAGALMECQLKPD